MQIYTVTQIAQHLKYGLETDPALIDLWISGEISNLRWSDRGHGYFTLKDESAQLRCVIFRGPSAARAAELLNNGVAIIAHGHISFYESRGDLQFYVDLVQPEGIGALYLQYELLKARLEAEGLFDPSRKRPLHPFPRCIGVVTSLDGAVIHDISNIIARRYPQVELVLAPTPVQGEGAVAGVIAALGALNDIEAIDTIIVARGGGSLEDLWPFNDERVARAIYASRVPIVTGIGHEVDFTIADFVADLRAPTPSAAAELAVPDRSELSYRLQRHQQTLTGALANTLQEHKLRLSHREAQLHRWAPDLDGLRRHLLELRRALDQQLFVLISHYREELDSRLLQLRSLNAQNTLKRGYALVRHRRTGVIISRVRQASSGDDIDINVSDGTLFAHIEP